MNRFRTNEEILPPAVVNRNRDPLEYQQSLIKSRIKGLKKDLPHLYELGWYTWAKKFFESKNKINLLCAANQIGKSSVAIRKNIEWACNKKLWPGLWDTDPKQFWYFYPTAEVATVEFQKKFVPEFLPRGDMKHHEWYGWEAEYKSGDISAIHFRSGVSIYFKTYAQKIANLQTSTVHMITADEEMPENFVDELLARLRRTGGYFNQVFTATQGFQLWYRAMECIGGPDEAFVGAFKQSVSMRDCMYYEDGTPTIWTEARITEAIAQCTTHSEVLKRIDGRFVKDEGRKYACFNPDKNIAANPQPIPTDWRIYAAVDVGSGGRGRSAGAVVMLAVDPLFIKGRVVKTWRGDHEETTAADILDRYRALKGSLAVTSACYDYQSREFGLIAARSGEPFISADKSRRAGEQVLNTLFQSGALVVDGGVFDNQKLITELMSVPAGDKKNRAFQDDLTDALRYAAVMIPWDFPQISPTSKLGPPRDSDGLEIPDKNWSEAKYIEWEIKQRRGIYPQSKELWAEFREEIDFWNDAYGN